MKLTGADFPCPKCEAQKGDPCVNIIGTSTKGQPRTRPHPERIAQVPQYLPQHGTYATYQRHMRAGEVPCDACRGASADYMARYRDNRPADYASEKERNNARGRALWRLAKAHPEQFRQFVTEESK